MDEVIAIFGGSFDPPHFGHISVVAWVISCIGVKKLLVIPCKSHPFGKEMASFEHRLEMCQSAFSIFGEKVEVLDIEGHMPQPSYTIDTLRSLRKLFPHQRLALIIGSDIPRETDKWKEFDEIKKISEVIVVRRPDFDSHGRGPLFPDISSTMVRSYIKNKLDVTDLIPKGVMDIIKRRSLYGFA